MPDVNETIESSKQTTPLDHPDLTGQAENNQPITTEPLGNPVAPETGEQITEEPGAESAPEVLPVESELEVLPVESAPAPTAPETILPTGQAPSASSPQSNSGQAGQEAGTGEPEMPQDPSASSEAPQDDSVENGAVQDSIAPTSSGFQNDKVIAEAGIMARLKAMLLDKLLAARQKKQEKIAANLEMIMAYAREHGKITNDEVEKLVKVKDRQALRYLAMLCKQGRLVRFGTKKNTFYKAVN